MFGVIIGTLISLLIVNYGYGTQIVFKYYFKGFKISEFYLDHLKYTFYIVLSCGLAYFSTSFIPGSGISTFIAKAILCLIIPNIVFIIAYKKNELFLQSLIMLKNIKYIK